MKNIFMPDNESLMTPDFLKKGEICYKFCDAEYKTVPFTLKQRLWLKINASPPNKRFNTNTLTRDEKTEYDKLFYNVNRTPKEKTVKECLLVVTFTNKLAVGIKVVDGKNVTAFKSKKVDEIKSICKKFNIKIIRDNYFSLYLYKKAYLNEIMPEEIWDYTARKYIKIEQRDKIFAGKLLSIWKLSDNETDYPETANDFLLRGEKFYNADDFDRAIFDFAKAMLLEPDDIYAYFWRGRAYFEKGGYDSAIADFSQIILLKPDYENAYFWRGRAYFEKGGYDSAIADFSQAILLKPDDEYAYFWRGRAYFFKGGYDSAIDDFSHAILLKPDYENAYFWRGRAYFEKGGYDSAIADFTRFIQLKPDNKDVYVYLFRGFAYKEKSNYAQARADVDKAIQLDPDNHDVKKLDAELQQITGGKNEV